MPSHAGAATASVRGRDRRAVLGVGEGAGSEVLRGIVAGRVGGDGSPATLEGEGDTVSVEDGPLHPTAQTAMVIAPAVSSPRRPVRCRCLMRPWCQPHRQGAPGRDLACC